MNHMCQMLYSTTVTARCYGRFIPSYLRNAYFVRQHKAATSSPIRLHRVQDFVGGDGMQSCVFRNSLRKMRTKLSRNDEASYISLNRGDPYSYSGGKRALLCGVSYENKKYRLKGPLNDVKQMKKFLMECFQFPEKSILVLTEKEEDERFKPTKRNIQNALKWLVKDTRQGSSLVFYYSGHGHSQPDHNNDELDGFDETICPMDFEEAGMILDDEINDAIVRPLRKGVKLHAIVDSCHSGTMLDLTHVYDKTKDDKLEWMNNGPPSGANKRTGGGLVIFISACTDMQLAAENTASSKIDGGGAFTSNLIAAVSQTPTITYGELLNFLKESLKVYGSNRISRMLRKMFRTAIVQDPQLSSSEGFDIFARRVEI